MSACVMIILSCILDVPACERRLSVVDFSARDGLSSGSLHATFYALAHVYSIHLRHPLQHRLDVFNFVDAE